MTLRSIRDSMIDYCRNDHEGLFVVGSDGQTERFAGWTASCALVAELLITRLRRIPVFAFIVVLFSFAFDVNPLGTLPFVQGRKWIRNETCLSAASWFHFPFFALHKREAAGQRLAVAFLLLPFLWRDKEKEVAAGLPRPATTKSRLFQ